MLLRSNAELESLYKCPRKPKPSCPKKVYKPTPLRFIAAKVLGKIPEKMEEEWGAQGLWKSWYESTPHVSNIDITDYTKHQRKTFLGKLQEKLLRDNCRNNTGFLDYNKYGSKQGIPFRPVSEPFCDNFMLYVRISPKHIREGKYEHIGSANKRIREFLATGDLPRVTSDPTCVKATCISAKNNLLRGDKVFLGGKEIQPYRRQYFKVACPNEDLGKVLKFLEEKTVRKELGIFLADVDISVDLSGSFSRPEVVRYMLSTLDFCMQNSKNVTPASSELTV